MGFSQKFGIKKNGFLTKIWNLEKTNVITIFDQMGFSQNYDF